MGRYLSREYGASPSAVDQIYEIRDHPLIDSLDKPDPYGYFDRQKLIGYMVASCDIVGSCYIVPEGPGWRGEPGRKGAPEWMWVLYSQYVMPVRFPNSPMTNFFQYFNERIPYEDVIWFKQDISLRDPYGGGYSPTYAGDVYAAQEDRFITMAEQVLGIGPRPSLIASSKDATLPMSEDQALRLEADFERKQTAAYAGGILVNRGALEFEVPQYPNADPAGITLSEYDRNNLATLFGQPPVFYTTDRNLSVMEAAIEEHAMNGVEPRCKQIASTLTAIAKMCDPRLFWAFDSPVPENEERKQKVIDMQLKTGQATINEVNEEGKLSKKPYGDEPILPDNMLPLSLIIKAHEQAMETAKAGVKQGDAGLEQGDKKLEIEAQKAEQAEADSDMETSGERAIALSISRELIALERKLAS